jgi:hypothetical protein
MDGSSRKVPQESLTGVLHPNIVRSHENSINYVIILRSLRSLFLVFEVAVNPNSHRMSGDPNSHCLHSSGIRIALEQMDR